MKPQRKHPRLKEYSYSSAGVYFLTICTYDRRPLFGSIVGRGILDAPLAELTDEGKCVRDTIQFLAERDENLTVEHFVIMPNHVHLLIALSKDEGGTVGKLRPANERIPRLVSALKRHTNRICGKNLWQRSYHDHVIRDENDFLRHWDYMESNPARWAEDQYYCGNCSMP